MAKTGRKSKHAAGNKTFLKAWSGRFTKSIDPRAETFASSLAVDIHLLPYDIQGSSAHAAMLARRRIISLKDARRIQQGLKKILAEWKARKLVAVRQDEDVHMLVERRLHELIGPAAGKLHTARSRNDQSVTDLKLYLRDGVQALVEGLKEVQRALFELAEKHRDWIMPGYTHMQVAQPVLVSHWLLAHLQAFRRDAQRCQALLRTSLDELPLGAAALAGTSHPIDRKLTAKLLGFSRVSENSMDTVSDRDFCLEFLAAAAISSVHFSRLAEELVWFSSSEFRFVTMDQGFATGSSILPQKRNPDIAELLRARSGRVFGNLQNLLTVMKGLPLTYNRDLQEDKEAVFDTLDTLLGACMVLAPLLDSLTLHRERLEEACRHGFPTATEAADFLARKGVPFREAHAAVGRAVTVASDQGVGIEDLDLKTWRMFHPAFTAGIRREIRPKNSVQAKKSLGGTSPDQVKLQLDRLRRELYGQRKVKINR